MIGVYTYAGWERLDLGLRNPNLAGALLAMVALAVWLPVFWGKRALWFSVPAFFGSAVLLCHTFSRGGLVALLVGGAATLLALRPAWSWRQFTLLALATLAVVSYALACGLGQRMAYGVSGTDHSVNHRAEIYTRLPAMMAAAPWGWGRGQAAEAYENWFQPVGSVPTYQHLISTHGTWMVERGWLFAWLYFSAWLIAAVLCWPRRDKDPRWLAIVFGMLSAYFVASCFSHVGADARLWILPVISLLAVILARAWRKTFPSAWLLAAALPMVAFFLGGAWAVGLWQNRALPVQKRGSEIFVGRRDAALWVLQPDPEVAGRRYGHDIRRYLQDPENQRSAVGVVLGDETPASRTFTAPVLVTGRSFTPARIAALRAPRIFWLNPPSLAAAELAPLADAAERLTILWGSLRRDASSREWQEFIGAHPPADYRLCPGAGLYVPNFPGYVMSR